jgi:hypothetical protein
VEVHGYVLLKPFWDREWFEQAWCLVPWNSRSSTVVAVSYITVNVRSHPGLVVTGCNKFTGLVLS